MAKQAPTILGRVTGLHGTVLQGWATDTSDPDQYLAVEVYYDGLFGHLARADESVIEPEVPPAQGHGFLVRLKPAWLAACRRLTVRVANQGPWLDGAIEPGQGVSQAGGAWAVSPAYSASRVDHNGGLRLLGWAAVAQGDPTVLTVQVVKAGKVLAQGIANRRLAFLNDNPCQGHGFEIDLPWELADGRRHTLDVMTDRGQPLAGSPVTLCTTAVTQADWVRQAWQADRARTTVRPRKEPSAKSVQGVGRGPMQSVDPPPDWLAVLLAHERRYPTTFGFSHYPNWLALYQPAPPAKPTRLRGTVLVVGSGPSDPACQASIDSVFAQRLPEDQVECFVVKPAALVQALRSSAPSADLVVPLLAGDVLLPHALDVMASELTRPGASGWGYADSDEQDAAGVPTRPWLKPDWDETLFLGQDIITPGVYLSGAIVAAVLAQADAAADSITTWSEFLVRLIALNRSPLHTPQVLYRQQTGRLPEQALSHAHRLAALDWLAQRRVPGARVVWDDAAAARSRVYWPLPDPLPKVSVIIPTRDRHDLLQTVMQGLAQTTAYPNVEWIVVDNESTCPQTLALLQALKREGARVLSYAKPFNYSAINNLAAQKASGELLLFLNNDIQMLHPDWLTEMVVQFQRPAVGVVGKKLLWPNGMVQHGGVVVGVNGLAAHAFVDCTHEDPGYGGLNRLDREQSAVTGACLMIRRSDFRAVGGFDERALPVTFNDVDLCLKIRQRNQLVVITTAYPLVHNESSSRGKEDTPQKLARAQRERSNFMNRWMTVDRAFRDPYYANGLNRDYLFGPYSGLGKPSLFEQPGQT